MLLKVSITDPGRSKKSKPSWVSYRSAIGDRSSLFAAVMDEFAPARALYVGSYLDLSPSTAIPSVTYIDVDRRAASFFADEALVESQLRGHARQGAGEQVTFEQSDYLEPLNVFEASIDLLISLYTVPSWDACRRYVVDGGLFLANASHGDASLAALDPALSLVAAVQVEAGLYSLHTGDLEKYLVPKKPATANADAIRASGRGLTYTQDAFAYVFRFARD